MLMLTLLPVNVKDWNCSQRSVQLTLIATSEQEKWKAVAFGNRITLPLALTLTLLTNHNPNLNHNVAHQGQGSLVITPQRVQRWAGFRPGPCVNTGCLTAKKTTERKCLIY